MQKLVHLFIFCIQASLTAVILVCLYLLFAVLDYEGGFPGFMGLVLFQPLMALLCAVVTVGAVFLMGLPIRVSRRLHHWWRKHFYLAILLAVLGVLFCLVSLVPSFMKEVTYQEGGATIRKTIPNVALFLWGWGTLAFGTLHLFPPLGIEARIKQLVAKMLKLGVERLDVKSSKRLLDSDLHPKG
ncbi:hypothetical protein GU926_12335 [Nibribacter ruber]|uniref:Uncharacterized protein n=1 Tax=Nibribacter ruber TaxID=2698458 RepID=A0A6P1P118_9BACT|nr:hypothetical protein [Nibribacter ruber]QHL88178.1 hypothetical protein GU926_12335 [Nibribacter ruber]